MPRDYRGPDLKDQVFGRLTAMHPERMNGGRWGWRCRCECGKEIVVRGDRLGSGNGLYGSCGCLKLELNRSGARSRTHGKTGSRTHRIWQAMRTRCENPNVPGYKDYGGRGIKVCERWQSFENFLADMGEPPTEDHSLDRYPDVNGDYEPGNCRWATDAEQARNKRTNHVLEFNGESKTVIEWSEDRKIHVQTILHRLRAGWTVEETLTIPPDKWLGRRLRASKTDG